MKSQEIIDFIKEYIDTSKTSYAIMLNGSWGIGKSYFISNKLRSSLFGYKSDIEKVTDKKKKNKKQNKAKSDDNQEKKYNSIKISMYGVENKFELAKKIYVAIRTGQESEDDEAIATGKLVTKSIISMLMGSLHINTNPKDLENLYNSINLKDTLLIFEDIERMSMDLFEFLGYVNNLVEQDNVKVLLVAYEDEIKKRLNTEQQKQYEIIKEKTIYETINYEPDVLETIKNINKEYLKDSIILKYFDDDFLGDIEALLYSYNNFRTYIFAINKANSFFKKINNKYLRKMPKDLICEIIRQIITMSFEFKSGKLNFGIDNQKADVISKLIDHYKLSQYQFCLYYVIYNYVNNIDEEIESTIRFYNKNLVESQKRKFAYIYYWIDSKDDDLKDAIGFLKEYLKTYDYDYSYFEEILYNLVLLKDSGFSFNLKEIFIQMTKCLIFCDYDKDNYFKISPKILSLETIKDEKIKNKFFQFRLLYKNIFSDYKLYKIKNILNKSLMNPDIFESCFETNRLNFIANKELLGIIDIENLATLLVKKYNQLDTRIVLDLISGLYLNQRYIFDKDISNAKKFCELLLQSINQKKITELKAFHCKNFIETIYKLLEQKKD